MVPDVLPSAVLKYLLAADANQFELADLAEVRVVSTVRVHELCVRFLVHFLKVYFCYALRGRV